MNLGRIVPLTFVQLYISFHFLSMKFPRCQSFLLFFLFLFKFFIDQFIRSLLFYYDLEGRKIHLHPKGARYIYIYIYQSKKLIPGKFPIPLFSGSPFRRFCHSKRPPPCAQQQDCARRRNKAASASGCIFK